MAVTPATFRQQFKAFEDPGVYDDEDITFWINLAVLLLPACRWGDLLDFGTSLYVAHNLVLGQRDARVAGIGGIPGGVVGPAAAKAVDKVSQSYDLSDVTLEGGGDWNMTSYGIRFLRLARMAGAGGIQL